jgi:hypothetical protein
VDIDGTTAPGFAGTPVGEVDFNGFDGPRFIHGPGGPAPAAFFARNLEVAAVPPDHARHRGDARGKQVEALVSRADTVVM